MWTPWPMSVFSACAFLNSILSTFWSQQKIKSALISFAEKVLHGFQWDWGRELWWSTKLVDMFSGAPFLFNSFMIYSCFHDICLPSITDWCIQQLLCCQTHFIIAQLHQQVHKLTGEQVCSWIHVSASRRNEYHSIADACNGLAEGRWAVYVCIAVQEEGTFEWTGMVFTGNSGFCITQGVFAQHNIGVHYQF